MATNTTATYSSNIPEEARQAYTDLIYNAQQLSQQPYTEYKENRQAEYSDLQKQGFQGLAQLAPSGYSENAGGLAQLATQQALGGGQYGAQGFQTWGSPMQVQGPGQMREVMGPQGPSQVGTYGSGPQQVQSPGSYQQVQGPGQMQSVSAYGSGAQQVQGPGQMERTSTQSFTQPGSAQAYMNPYMQSVVDVQQREATRADDIARGSRNARAVGQGAFGGSRQAIVEAEAGRNLAQQHGDIQAQGLNQAYQQAQQQFNQEQNLGLQSQQANQNTGTQYQQMNQQAQQANQQAGLQYGNQYLQAGQANQSTAAQYAQLGQQAQFQNQNTGTQYQQMNQQAQQANQNAALGFGSQYLQAGQANQQAGLTTQQMNQQAQQANQNMQGQYAGMNQQAQQANQNANLSYGNQYLEAQRLGEASRQFGANYGLQQLQTGLQGATTLGNIGSDLYKQDQQSAIAQTTAGAGQQEQAQRGLDQQYQDFLNQKNYASQNMGFLSDILHGTKDTSRTQYTTTPPASNTQQLLSLGTTLYGMNKNGAFGARGGEIKRDNIGRGIASLPIDMGDYADGGIIGFAGGGDPFVGAADGTVFTPEEWAARTRGGSRALTVPGTEIVDMAPKAGLLRRGAQAIGKWAMPVNVAVSGYDALTTPNEELADRLGIEYDPAKATLTDRAMLNTVATADNALFNVPSYLWGGKKKPGDPAAAKKPGDKGIDTGAVNASGKSSASASLSGGATAAGGVSIKQIRDALAASGYDPDKATEEDVARLRASGALRQQAVADELTGIEKLHAERGELGKDRFDRLNKEVGEHDKNVAKASGDMFVDMGLRMMQAGGGKQLLQVVGEAAAPAFAGFKLDRAKLEEKHRAALNSLDELKEARLQMKDAQGRELIGARKAVKLAQADTEEKIGAVMHAAGVEKYAALPKLITEKWLASDEAAKNRQAQVSIANARNAGIASLGGGKPFSQAQFDTAVRNEANALEKNIGTFHPTVRDANQRRALANAQALRTVKARMTRETAAYSHDGWSSDTSGDGKD